MMYRHGFRAWRLYVAFDRGLDWRGWVCALVRLQLGLWATGKVLHAQAVLGPFLVDLKIL